eukprot:6189729-Pleurochrysis_carterae.AAC.1
MEGGASLEMPVTDSGEVTTTTAPLALGDGQCGSVHRKNRLQGQITSGEDLANRKPWPTCVDTPSTANCTPAELNNYSLSSSQRWIRASFAALPTLAIFVFRNRDVLHRRRFAVLAAELNALFGAVVYITPVIGAYAADVHLGRYRAILYFSAVYLLGMLTVTVRGRMAVGREECVTYSAVPLCSSYTSISASIRMFPCAPKRSCQIGRPRKATFPFNTGPRYRQHICSKSPECAYMMLIRPVRM